MPSINQSRYLEINEFRFSFIIQSAAEALLYVYSTALYALKENRKHSILLPEQAYTRKEAISASEQLCL